MNKDIKKYALIGGTVAVLGLGTFAFIQYRKKRRTTKENTGFVKGNVPQLGINTFAIAKQIGLDLGTAYSMVDPRSWTENDDAVLKSVLKVPKTHIPRLISDYKSIYNRSLPSDLQSKLDDWKEVEYLFT